MGESKHNHHHHSHLDSRKALFFSLIFTSFIFLLELVGGYVAKSLSLLSDAWHVASDALAIGLSWFAKVQGERSADLKRTFGYKRFEVLSGLVNGVTLIVVVVFIVFEGFDRFFNPKDIKIFSAISISVIGLLANIIVAFILNPHKDDSINTRSAFLHVIADALSSVGVIIGLLIIYITGLRWVDPLIAILISLYLFYSAFKLVKESIHIFFEGAPLEFDILNMIDEIKKIENVKDVHDVHVWSVSGKDIYVSMHIVVEEPLKRTRDLLNIVEELLEQNFGVDHINIQIEEECSKTNITGCFSTVK
ncbi:MAG: cation diffusion facilitator family transporter [Proteobacteria bacterium]|nr:cation diffusion facilitator family transporter [Pseudomonadota bacterium]